MVRTLKNILYQGAFTGKMVYYLQVKWHESCDGLKYSRKIKCVHVCACVCVMSMHHISCDLQQKVRGTVSEHLP